MPSSGCRRQGSLLSRLATALLIMAAVQLPDVGCVPLLTLMESAPHISQFTKLLTDTGGGSQMNLTGGCKKALCPLVFAPSNEAMAAAYQADPIVFSAIDKTALSNHHYLTVLPDNPDPIKGVLSAWSSLGPGLGTDIGYGKVQILKTTSSTLYWLAKQNGDTWSYRINNAAIIVAESDKVADNGVYHVLDQVALPIGNQMAFKDLLEAPDSDTAKYLKISKSLKCFNQWMTRDREYQFVYNALVSDSTYKIRTVFLPSDSAWDRIPAPAMQQLNGSLTELRKVFAAHFATDISVFTSWMTLGSSIAFNTGQADVQSYSARMYLNSQKKAFVSVGGVVAQFVDKSINYPIGDTVIHVVDRVLAFTYETLATLAEMNAPAFYSRCMSVASCQALLNSSVTNRTLFAPSDVSGLNGLNASQLEQVLKMHFVPRHIGKPDMTESDLVTAQDNSGEIRFRFEQNGTKYYVEGRLPSRGFVRAELLMYDQPAKNGIFHKIAFPLGQPRQTVQDFVNSKAGLTKISGYIGSNDFFPSLGSLATKYTVFPPNNAAMEAFAAYKNSIGISTGELILEEKGLRDRVFRRMILPDSMIVADVVTPSVQKFSTANVAEKEEVSINFMGAAGLKTRSVLLTGANVVANVSLAAGEYECTNGMVYPISVVLFRENDIEGYTRSGGRADGSLAALLLSALLALVARL